MTEPEMLDRDAFLARVEVCLERDDFQVVLELAASRFALYPGDIDATIVSCQAWIRMGRLAEAMEALSEVEDKIARLGRIYISLGDICRASGLLEESLRYYRRFIAIHPHSPLAGQARETISSLEGGLRPAAAEEEKEEGLASDFYTLTMADLYMKQGHFDMAQQVLEAIATREELREAAMERLNEIREIQRAKIIGAVAEKKRLEVLSELQRWLDNTKRMKSHVI
ncbi:MAG: hypothetical protein U1C55_07025 [Smithellaceae bacterium]|nr:hypothetical protein [Smithellaceae bacterium]